MVSPHDKVKYSEDHVRNLSARWSKRVSEVVEVGMAMWNVNVKNSHCCSDNRHLNTDIVLVLGGTSCWVLPGHTLSLRFSAMVLMVVKSAL